MEWTLRTGVPEGPETGDRHLGSSPFPREEGPSTLSSMESPPPSPPSPWARGVDRTEKNHHTTPQTSDPGAGGTSGTGFNPSWEEGPRPSGTRVVLLGRPSCPWLEHDPCLPDGRRRNPQGSADITPLRPSPYSVVVESGHPPRTLESSVGGGGVSVVPETLTRSGLRTGKSRVDETTTDTLGPVQ